MINWADFPILLPLGGGRLAASWASRRGEGYEVRLSYSKDGMRWTRPVVPHRDGTPTEHGFVSLLAEGDGARVMWLDGRSPAGTSLRTTVLHPDGSVDPERALDPRVCDCCQTSALRVGADVVVAYRDRSPNETRDISLVRFRGHGAKEIASAPPDGWRIDGCPVNGPALATRGGSLALAWFAAPRDRAQVRVALSRDGGRSFGPPTRVDEGSPLGRVQVQLGSDGSAFVSWVEAKPERALVLARRVSAGGVLDPPMVVARAGMARGLGYPRMARSGSRLFFAWTEPGAATRVRVAMLDAPGRPAGL